MKISGNIYKPRLTKLTRLYLELKNALINETKIITSK